MEVDHPHWVYFPIFLDMISHAPDLALYPYSKFHLGLNINLLSWAWWIELGLSIYCYVIYLKLLKPIKHLNIYAVWIVIILLLLHIVSKMIGL